MILRHRCRSLLSKSSFKPLSRNQPPLPPLSFNPHRYLRTTSPHRAENEPPDDIDQAIEEIGDLSHNREPEFHDVPPRKPSTSDLFDKRSRDEDEEKGFQTYDQIDASMNIEELGLKKMTRKAKQSFLRWIMQEGTRYERFPQHILMRLEERRIEKARKGSEDRMFQRMNKFFNTLSLQEIEQGRLHVTEEKGQRKKVEREQQPEPTPFQQLVTEQIKMGANLKQIESKALSLLRQYDQKLHTLYKNYIDWSDYQLQKRRLWFEFPNIPTYADVIARNRSLTEGEIFEQEERRMKEKEAAKAAKGREKVENQGQVKATTQKGLQLDATEPATETLSEAREPITGGDSKNTSEQPVETTETVAESELLQNTVDQSPGEDLAYYLGPRIDESIKFPIVGTPSSNYLASRSNSPFRLNGSFKPWRPIPHATRLQMFDAWREGLGLRNVAWLGGVSWRRVDGIIGILKREWEFVEKGGKLENEMASYMDALLAETPLLNPKHQRILLEQQRDLSVFPIVEVEDRLERQQRYRNRSVANSQEFDLLADPIPLADPKTEVIPGTKSIVKQQCPMPDKPIFILPQTLESIDGKVDRGYKDYVQETEKLDENNRKWEASQKEPLVEIPIKRTKQYFAIIQEMEEYSEKRAAKALNGVGGNTMTEKEEGIKLYERFFGGLRSLGGREKFQGIPPWERNYSERERAQLAKKVERLAKLKQRKQKLPLTALTPADAFRISHTTNVDNLGNEVLEENRKERVIWRFEDVTWVKQRTIRPRKQSYVGTLDQRVQIESGVQRYGPYGIGGGVIEGVGGVKNIIERGLDGEIRRRSPGREKRRVRREIVV